MNRTSYLWMGVACLGMLLLGCYGDDSYMYQSYCETYVCKESTEVRQRPTSFALELLVNDTSESRMAHLFTIDCAYLPDEDSLELSTFCVDSLKYGNSDSLRHLPQKSKYTYNYYTISTYVQDDGHVLQSYARIPIDDDDHLRFTLVDRQNNEKTFDLDLSGYINMYKLRGDTFDFKFPENTSFYAYTRDTTFGEKDCPVSYREERSFGCYNYSVRDTVIYYDTTVYCIVEPGDHYENIGVSITTSDFWGIGLDDIGDSSDCKSQRFYASIDEGMPSHVEYVPCNRITLDEVPDSLSISNLYSRRAMSDRVLDSLGDRVERWYTDQPDSELVSGFRYVWHAINHLDRQGPDGEDDFAVYTIYRDIE